MLKLLYPVDNLSGVSPSGQFEAPTGDPAGE